MKTTTHFKCPSCGRSKSRRAKLCHNCHAKEVKQRRRHGTVNMYSNFGCKCAKCKAAWAEYRRTKT